MRTLTTRPLVVAHRGASAYAPENTIAAFELAIAQGADVLEFDVHLSRDDQPVVIHDFTLDRTTNGRGPVRELTVQELKRLDAGGWFHRKYAGQQIQTLHEILERFRGRVRFGVELKAGSDFYPGIEERVIATLQIYQATEHTLVLSFDHPALGRVRAMDPGIRTGALVAHRPLDPEAVAPGIATALCPVAHLLTEADARRALAAGLEVFVWVPNDPALMDRLIAWGVTGIVTDRPDLLRSRFSR
ncbi:MAG: glycerophosphodiester phosphodiesterase [Candidatus Rokubacteria bacterium]|nr:glycerophosphodiester phosphodiesterase [Candidatus Rokubacteria bacterium]